MQTFEEYLKIFKYM